MNTNHRSPSEELDAFLTARQRGEQPEPAVASNPDMLALAERIQTLTEAAQPHPQFAASLENRLKQAGSRRGKVPHPVSTERNPHMFRRIAFSLISVGVLALIAIMLLPRPQVVTQTLPPLPALGGASPYGKGGGAEVAPMSASGRQAGDAAAPNAEIFSNDVSDTNIFSGTEFILQTDLPATPGSLTVYSQPEAASLDIESFRQLAARFGVQGPVYVQNMMILYDAPMAAPGKEIAPDAPTSYTIFDGTRQFSSFWNSVTYTDHGVQPIAQDSDIPPFEQQVAAAETFLKDHGLLDFPYRAEADPYWPLSVRFMRQVGDYALENSEIEVQIGQGGQVQMVSYHLLPLETIGDYPLRSAQDAWDALLSNKLTWEQMSFWTYGSSADPFAYPSWQPQYHPGETVELMGFITVYEPAAGEQATPRLTISDQLELVASDADLQTLQGLADRQLMIWGQVRQAENGALVLDVAGWRETTEYGQVFSGSLARQGDAVVFVREDGQTFLLPHVPQNLPDGIAVEVSGWETGRQENGLPVLEWNYIQTPIPDLSSDIRSKSSSMTVEGSSGMGGGTSGASAPIASDTVPEEAPAFPETMSDTVPAYPGDAASPWNPPDWGPGKAVEGLEGQLFANVYENPDGTLQYSFSLSQMPLKGDGWNVTIENTTDPQSLAALDRQWVRVWGQYQDQEWPAINVERFEAVDAGRPVQAWLGNVVTEVIDNQTVAVLVTPDQQRLVLASTLRWPDSYQMYTYQDGHQFVFEGILRPETAGGLPVIEEITWNTNEEIDAMTDVNLYTLTPRPEIFEYTPPPPLLPGKATVEQVQLAYTVVYSYDEATATSTQIVQPVWRFSGHAEDGSVFVILIQAVEDAYLK